MNIGFIGVGNMAQALVHGIKQTHPDWQVVGFDKYAPSLEEAANNDGLLALPDIAAVMQQSTYIFVAVKPQQYDEVLATIAPLTTEQHVIITIAIGYDITKTASHFSEPTKIVRAMPNTPAQIGQGMTGVCFNTQIAAEDKTAVEAIFSSCGAVTEITEADFTTFAAVAGSLPAYVYMMIEALADVAVLHGMARSKSYEVISQAVAGSALMVKETGVHPAVLKDRVCSPNGTTIAGVAALEANGLRHALIAAIDACIARTDELENAD